MLALPATASSANSALILIIALASVLVLFWRTALRIVMTIAAIAVTVLIISGVVLIVDYAHALK
jgi:hypothetical protein